MRCPSVPKSNEIKTQYKYPKMCNGMSVGKASFHSCSPKRSMTPSGMERAMTLHNGMRGLCQLFNRGASKPSLTILSDACN